MEPTIQFDPGRCVLVLGPQIAAASLALKDLGAPAALSYSMLFEGGMQKMLELESFQSKEDKIRKQSLLAGAYELEPSFVANKVVESLRSHERYEQWLSEMFSSLYNLPVHSGPNSVVEDLKQLQEKGVLLVYTYYDMILDRAMDTTPFLMEEEDVKNWGLRKVPGILHVHGVHSHPDTVMCDCVNYDKIVAETSAGRRLREICRNRTVLFVGFDGRFYDPFLPKVASSFLSGPQTHSTALLLTFSGGVTNPTGLLKVKLSSMVGGLSKFLVPSLSPYKPALREGVDPSKSLNTTLLFADKSSCTDAAEKVKTMSAIKVHQLTISHEQQSHQLLLYLDHEGLRNLWRILFSSENSNSSLHSGLLGVVLDSGVTVWCKSVSRSGGNGSASAAMEISSASPASHPTLSTSVSVIGSMWTPIATPSVVSQHQPPRQLVPSTSTRPTLPSPLITSHSSLSLNSKGLTPELPRHVGLLTPHHAHHNKREVRRVQSERYNLSYQDRINDMKAAGKKNGVLVHRESAPEFVYTSEGTVAYRSDNFSSHSSSHSHHLHATHKPSSVSQPSPLVKDGSNLELKIEYIDQFQQSTKSPNPHLTTPGSVPKMGGSRSTRVAGGVPSDGPSSMLEKKDVQGKFMEEKQKWINDAKNWSKMVSSEIYKLSGSSLQPQLSSSDRSKSSLNTNISPEEQEKILQQHFDLVKSQVKPGLQQGVTSATSTVVGVGVVPGSVGVAATPMLSLSSLSSLSSPSSRPSLSSGAGTGGAQTPGSKSPHTSPRPNRNLSPLQLTSATAMGGVTPPTSSSSAPSSGSPKKSPINPLLLAAGVGGVAGAGSGGQPQQPPQTSSIFSYFPSAANPALQSPASFLYNPSVSQYAAAAAAAAMFNPFQAAVQLLSPPQGSNNNTSKQPMLLTDPSVLQALHQLSDKVPCILADGSITFVPANLGAQTPIPPTQIGAGAAASTRESPIAMNAPLKSPNFRSTGSSSSIGGGESHKRPRSPDHDTADIRPSLPKRRRSSSLPDIAQLSQLDVKGVQQQTIREDEEREKERERESEREREGGKQTRPQMLMKQPRHRQTPPPNMIQIPQEVKLNDPMLGFPTPPQSSPLIGNFAIPPFVLSTPTFQNPTPMTPVTPSQEQLSTEELRELVEASGGGQTNLPPSPEGTSLPPFPAGRGPIQLWQFLLDLLLSPDKQHMIQWTGNGYEFRILAPEDIAKLWGARKNKPRMNYDKLSRGLRYYYSKGIMDKVPGKKLTFKYTCDVQHYVRSRSVQALRSSNFPNGGTPTAAAVTIGGGGGGGGAVGVASSVQTPSLIPAGITIAASAVTVDNGSKSSPHHRLDSVSIGSVDEEDEERNPMDVILPQTSGMCNPSETEFCQVEEV